MSNTDYYSDRYEPPRRSRRNRQYNDNAAYSGYADDDYPAAGRGAGQAALIPQARQNSDSSYVEEVQRDFPPPGGYAPSSRSSRPSYARRASSLDGYDGRYAPSYAGSSRGIDRDDDRSLRGRSRSRVDKWRGELKEDFKDPKRAISKHRNEIGGAALGAVIAAGGKELYDRYDAKEHPSKRHRSSSRRRLAQAGLGVAGALVGAEAAKKIAQRNRREVEDDERAYDENGKPAKNRRKSMGEYGHKAAGAAAGLIGPVIAAQANQRGVSGYGAPYPPYGGGYGGGGGRGGGGRYDDRGGRDGRDRSYGSSRSRDRTPEKNEKIQQALKAALTAAAAEGWRSRDEPGGALSGEKLRRIVTAAVSAAGVDALVDKHPDDHGTRNTIVSALAGLLGNRVINGSRDADFGTTDGGRGYSRSRSRGRDRSPSGGGPGLGGLAGLAGAAAAGKALWDRSRSRKRDDEDGRGRRGYSRDGYSRSPPRRSRSRSVIDKGLSKLGLKDKHDDDRYDDRRRYSSDDGYGRSRGGIRGGGAAGAAAGAAGTSRNRSSSSSSNSSMDSATEKKERRKRRGKEYLTAGLATVATVNAAHEVYEGYEKNRERIKEVKEGKMSEEEAARLKKKGHLKDAAALGLAALGIKGAMDNWKETRHTKKEADEWCRQREEHRRRRLEGGNKKRSKSADYADDYYPAPIYDDQPGYGAPPAFGPIYSDGNPYAAGGVAEPPLSNGGGARGYDDRRY